MTNTENTIKIMEKLRNEGFSFEEVLEFKNDFFEGEIDVVLRKLKSKIEFFKSNPKYSSNRLLNFYENKLKELKEKHGIK